jgi:hypothetical protein
MLPLGFVTTASQPTGKSSEVLSKTFPIAPPRLSVYSRRGITLNRFVCPFEVIDIVDMMPQEGKLHLFNPTCCLSYPLQHIWQVRHGSFFPDPVFGTCFVKAHSSWPGRFPPQSPPTGIAPVFVCSTVSSVSMALSDFPRPFIAPVFPWDFLHEPCLYKAKHGISRFPLRKPTCVHRISDHAVPFHLSR